MNATIHTAKQITVHSLAIAFVCVSTMLIQIPIPLGYMHLGNACILLAGVFFGPVTGLLAGGIGSAMADLLTGYTQWVLPTLLIKSLMGFLIGWIARSKGRVRMSAIQTFLACFAGMAVMIIGYFLAGALLYGSLYTGALQIPELALEAVLGMLLFYSFGLVLDKAGINRLLDLDC